MTRTEKRPMRAEKGRRGPLLRWLGGFAAFAAIGLALYQPALAGEFFSDDRHYVYDNPYLQELSAANVAAILDPTSVVSKIVENYAPLHLLLHAVEWQFFGTNVVPYHVVNVLFHALASLLLVALFLRSGVESRLAWVGGLVFLAHPANVEAVAFIAQLKTSVALVLTLGALLLHPHRPGWAASLFALALLAKPTAVVALPVAVAFGWLGGREARDAEGARLAWRWGWLALWGGIFLAFSVAELAAFFDTAGRAPPIYPDPWVRMRSICAIALRYLVMAVSGTGLSVFHETPAAASWLDAWWIGSVLMLSAIAARMLAAWRARADDLPYWLWTAVSFGPVSGVIPLPFPMADRYLYFLLPGMLGVALLWLPRIAQRSFTSAPALRNAAPFGLLALALLFAVQTHARAAVWRSPALLMADAERNYPEGAAAMTRKARRAALAGDVDGAVRAMRRAMDRGYNRLDHLLWDSAYQPLHEDPRFRPLLQEMATEMITRLGGREELSQVELRVLGQAHIVMKDLPAAINALERALEVGGPVDEKTRTDLEAVKRAARIEADRERRRRAREARD